MSYVRVAYPKFQVIKSDGTPAEGYLVYTYDAGTANEATTYSDKALSSPNANPVVLNSRGECDIYTNSAIKIVLKTDLDVEVWTVDYVAEQVSTFLSGSATEGTTNNAYAITFSPTLAAFSNNLMVVWTPDVDNTDTVGTQSFTGTGPNDCVISGPYSGTTGGSVFQIKIDDAVSSPNTFKWRKDAESWTTAVAITGGDQSLKEGISVNFAVLSGHVLDDLWAVTVQKPATLNPDSLGAKLIYKNVGGALELLEGGDIQEDYPATCVYSSSQDCWVLNNPSDPVYETAQRDMIRTVTADNYTLSVNDHGTEINFINSSAKTLTLCAAAEFADKFVDIRAGGTSGTLVIAADGSEVIYGRGEPGGATTYGFRPLLGIAGRLTSNGVDWHVLNEPPMTPERFIYTSGATWTKPKGLRFVDVHVVAGGGGGGQYYAATPLYAAGGGGGGYSFKRIATASLGSTETVTVGAGGAAGSSGGGAATAGGTSSFGAHCSATGGGGGTPIGSAGGAGGAGASGNINLTGEDGDYLGTATKASGGAAPGPYGGKTAQSDQSAGRVYGGGGAGGFAGAAGAGANGLVVVEEHF